MVNDKMNDVDRMQVNIHDMMMNNVIAYVVMVVYMVMLHDMQVNIVDVIDTMAMVVVVDRWGVVVYVHVDVDGDEMEYVLHPNRTSCPTKHADQPFFADQKGGRRRRRRWRR